MVDFSYQVDFRRDKPISMAEVARMFNVSEQTANKWRKRKDNRLIAARVGKGYYTTLSNIQLFTEQPEDIEEATPHSDPIADRELARHGI